MRLAITSQHYDVTTDVERYLAKKLGKLGRYVPSDSKTDLHATVHLVEHPANSTNKYSCEVIIRLKHEEIVAKESTINMFAAIDIVEAKLHNQIRKYKEKHDRHVPHHVRLWHRIRGGAN